jgi:ABC-type transport system substrate-binding protein
MRRGRTRSGSSSSVRSAACRAGSATRDWESSRPRRIVSPQALRPRSGEGASFRDRAPGSGTGAFELRTRSSEEIELTRSASWWGSSTGLGPALDSIAFTAVPAAGERLELLRTGTAQVVEPLTGAASAAVADDPLLVEGAVARVPVGMEASVRGLARDSAVPALSGVWLTRLTR